MTAPQPTPDQRRPSIGTGRFSRPSIGFPIKPSRWRAFWQPPVPVLIAAGAGGEVLVARTRLGLTLLVLVIPILDLLRRPGVQAAYVGLVAAVLGVALAVAAFQLARNRVYAPPIGFATSLLDVTLVSAVLCTFLVLRQPLAAVNSRVVFLVYFVAIAASALRFDPRICAVTGAAAIVEYAAVDLLASRWPLHALGAAPGNLYGAFSWGDQVSRLLLLAIAGAVSTALVLRTRELQWLSARDKLTGFLNRGIFDDLLTDASLRARRYGRPLSVLMLDVDQFKQFNDSWGHAAGDEALKAVSTAIKQSVRQGEVVARYGGDEFVVLFPETRPETAVQRGEKIRMRIPPIVAGARGRQQAIPVTISVGVASLPADGADGYEVLNQADMRLYEAKHGGRNAVVGPELRGEPPAAQADTR
jgi:diguanylate cyclase (GGDEF)-like protein